MLRPLLAGVGFFLFALLIHWQAGTFQSEFGRYQDEGMHYVTGLMLHDFILSPAHWRHPMAYAQDYYLHFPKVGLGNWPPIFPLIQAAWEILFGISRVSLLFLMILFNALLAWCVQHELHSRIHPWLATLAGVFTIAAPLSQAQASMVMAEIPLALFSLLSLLAFLRFFDSASTRDGVWFGLWSMVAIMTKGNAWLIFLVVPATLLFTGRLRLTLTRGWWLAIGIIALICLPYTWFSMRIVTQGWDTRTLPGLSYLVLSLWKHTVFVVEILGPVLSALAAVALLIRTRPAQPFWLVMGMYALAIVGFHVAVPTSIEARKIYQIVPIMAIFAAASLDFLARRFSLPPPAVAAGGLLLFLFGGFRLLTSFVPGFGQAVETAIARPDSAGAVVLISSNRLMEDAEAAIISEWAERDRTRGTYLARGNKLLSTPISVDQRIDFAPLTQSPGELAALLDGVPVAYVILHTGPIHLDLAQRPYRHHAQLAELLAAHPEAWEPIHRSTRQALGDPHEVILYRNRRDLTGIPIRFTVDLSRKIGHDLSTQP